MAVAIVYETHAITLDNERGSATGWLPGQLSAAGRLQAQKLGERRRHIDLPYPDGQSYNEVVSGMRAFLRDLAAGWEGKRVLVIAHSANRWALDHLLQEVSLGDLVDAPFNWQEGWLYELPAGWTDQAL